MVRITTSVTLEKEHIMAIDNERDKYTSRSDFINRILDMYYSEGFTTAHVGTGTNGMTVRTEPAISMMETSTDIVCHKKEE